MTIRIMKFGMNKHVPHMNPHVKFQKLGFNSFGEICNFGFFDSFEKQIKNIIANFVKMEFPINMKCTNLIPKFQEGTIT